MEGNKGALKIWLAVLVVVIGGGLSFFVSSQIAQQKYQTEIENKATVYESVSQDNQTPETTEKKVSFFKKLFQNIQNSIKEKRLAKDFIVFPWEKSGSPDRFILSSSSTYVIEAINLPDLSAKSFVVGDLETGEILIEKNADEIFPMASVTKLMTASVGKEFFKQSDLLTVSNKAISTEGYRGNLRRGEKISFGDILYPILMVSSNDASEVVAEGTGDRKSFLNRMNEKSRELGMTATNYEDASGLSQKNTSTSRDLFRLASFIYKNEPSILEISKENTYKTKGHEWKNINRLIADEGFIGGKTGYTSLASRTGVFAYNIQTKEGETRPLVFVILRSSDRTGDVKDLKKFVQSSVRRREVSKETGGETATLTFLGDIMLDRGVRSSAYKNFGGSYDQFFESLSPYLLADDISFANLEGPISDGGTKKGSRFSFRMEPKVATSMKSAGIDLVSFANNHIGDYGTEAFLDTLNYLDEQKINYVGAGINRDEALSGVTRNINGISIAYLGATGVGPDWMEAGINTPGIILSKDEGLIDRVKELKSTNDIVIVSLHIGEEYKTSPAKDTESLAKLLIEAGATIVAGHHPHVIGEVERYGEGLIMYSLGNAIFDQYHREDTMEGMLAQISVSKNGIEDTDFYKFDIDNTYRPNNIREMSLNIETGKKNDKTISIGWAGDIVPGYKKYKPLPDQNDLFKNTKSITESPDIMIGNLEGVISNKDLRSRCGILSLKKCFAFKGETDVLTALKNNGFDALTVANNHSFDYGEAGFEDSIANIETSGLIPIGKKQSVTYISVDGVSLGLVAFSFDNNLNSLIDDRTVKSLVEEAEAGADIVLVFFHGGAEGVNARHVMEGEEWYLNELRGDVKAFAKTAIDSGADAIFGAGPHVIRGIEWYKRTPIIYSSGNFAGYKAFSLDGPKDAFVPVIEFNQNGSIKSFEINPVVLSDDGIPDVHPSPEKVFDEINSLSITDFGASGAKVDEKGLINPPYEMVLGSSYVQKGCSSSGLPFVPNISNFVIDRETALPFTTPPSLFNLKGLVDTRDRDICVNKETLDAFIKMVNEAKKVGIDVVPTSGFRDEPTQNNLFANSKKRWGSGIELFSIAEPGHSEHHLGTALDVTSSEIGYKSATSKFADTKSYQWLLGNASRFGFSLSYPEGQEKSTGYIFESWHWRYTGEN